MTSSLKLRYRKKIWLDIYVPFYTQKETVLPKEKFL